MILRFDLTLLNINMSKNSTFAWFFLPKSLYYQWLFVSLQRQSSPSLLTMLKSCEAFFIYTFLRFLHFYWELAGLCLDDRGTFSKTCLKIEKVQILKILCIPSKHWGWSCIVIGVGCLLILRNLNKLIYKLLIFDRT